MPFLLDTKDGSYIQSGFVSVGGRNDIALAKFNSNGSLDQSFGQNGITTIESTTNIGQSQNDEPDIQKGKTELTSDGRLIVVGVSNLNGNYDTFLARLTSDGKPSHTNSEASVGLSSVYPVVVEFDLSAFSHLADTLQNTTAPLSSILDLSYTSSNLDFAQFSRLDQSATVGNTLYFVADRELWRTDGTVVGTYRVRNVSTPWMLSENDRLLAVGNDLYFTVNGQTQLWKRSNDGAFSRIAANGQSANTQLSSIDSLVFHNGVLYFTAGDRSDLSGNVPRSRLWQYDGLGNATRVKSRVTPVAYILNPSELRALDFGGTATLFFKGQDDVGSIGLWSYQRTGSDPVATLRFSQAASANIPEIAIVLQPNAPTGQPTEGMFWVYSESANSHKLFRLTTSLQVTIQRRSDPFQPVALPTS